QPPGTRPAPHHRVAGGPGVGRRHPRRVAGAPVAGGARPGPRARRMEIRGLRARSRGRAGLESRMPDSLTPGDFRDLPRPLALEVEGAPAIELSVESVS